MRTIHAFFDDASARARRATGQDNGVHASASPFEGLAERMNWLEQPMESDAFGKKVRRGPAMSRTPVSPARP